ncbi:Uncharacterised protein [Kluyvera ascorbata]|nr:hypothetical protein STW0522KLE44_41900 [Klebsiella sp. STW0522-44]STX01099.1 Uncharacterised protein [Kluyvera ascorbata]
MVPLIAWHNGSPLPCGERARVRGQVGCLNSVCYRELTLTPTLSLKKGEGAHLSRYSLPGNVCNNVTPSPQR